MTSKDGVLIIGYGRAGRRHEESAKSFGLTPFIYDPLVYPNQSKDYPRVLLQSGAVKYAVIATPPDSHLDYLEMCLVYRAKVLCEKPLCGLGQLDRIRSLSPDNPVMVAYNYHYHPKLVKVISQFDQISMKCRQYRPGGVPEWGLLLDHVSHDLDIAQMVCRESIRILSANHYELTDGEETIERWEIKTNRGIITEEVSSDEACQRSALIVGDYEQVIDIDPDSKMFSDMWAAFLEGRYYPNLVAAIRVQRLLGRCHELNIEEYGNKSQ